MPTRLRAGWAQPGRRAALESKPEHGICCSLDVSLEYQLAAGRYVLRVRESGGAVRELGRYVGFCGAEGETLQWFLKPDSLTLNADHAIVLAPTIASIEIWFWSKSGMRFNSVGLLASIERIPLTQLERLARSPARGRFVHPFLRTDPS